MPFDKSEFKTTRMIIALVVPAGAPREDIIEGLNNSLKDIGFETIHIKLSKLLERLYQSYPPS